LSSVPTDRRVEFNLRQSDFPSLRHFAADRRAAQNHPPKINGTENLN
jgi:hypothetical protein